MASSNDPKDRFADVGVIDTLQSNEGVRDPSSIVDDPLNPTTGLKPGVHDISQKSKDVLAKYISKKTVDPETSNEYTLTPDPSLPTSILRVNGEVPALGGETNVDRHLSKEDTQLRLGYETDSFGKLANPGSGLPPAKLDSHLLNTETTNVLKLSETGNLQPYVTDVLSKNEFGEIKKARPDGYDLIPDSQITDLDPQSPDQKIHAGKILSKNNLASYISKKTNDPETRNDYPLSGAPTASISVLRTNLSTTPPLRAGSNKDQHIKYEDLQTRHSYKSQEYTKLELAGVAGKEDSGKSGNELLKSETVQDKLKPYTSAVLRKNRFYPATEDAKNPFPKPDNDSPAFFTKVKENNEISDTDQVIKLLSYGQDARKEISAKELGFIGKILMLRATGEINTEDPDFNPDKDVGSLLPGITQMAIERVHTNILEARDIISSRREDRLSPGSDSEGPVQKSWGSMNNHLEQFSGIMPAGMVTLSLALILATQATMRLMNSIFAMMNNPDTIKYDSQGRLPLGKYDINPHTDSKQFGGFSFGGVSNVNTLLNMPATSNPFAEAVNKGLEVFFRANGNNSVESNVKGGFAAAFDSPGYYAIFVRAISRSAVSITDELLSVTKNPNPVAISQAVINLIDVLRQSKVFSAVRIFAYLGDTELNRRKGISEWNTDALPPGVPRHFKSRKDGSRQLTWRQADLPTNYILPMSAQIASLAAKNFGSAGVEAFYDPSISNVKPNLTSQDVKKIEDELEAEYVPFYFQDLRSKEIIAFPAFITAMTDEFNVSWDGVDAYGRMDQVKTYKNTTRRLSVSFKVISLDPKDFDSMWVKINKLITMIYPQYSKGKVYGGSEPGDVKFTQPFSQTIKSSPVVRIRLGDLWKSNYSKFALARLFGLGQKDDEEKTSFLLGVSSDAEDQAQMAKWKLEKIRTDLQNENANEYATVLQSYLKAKNITVKVRPGKEYKLSEKMPNVGESFGIAFAGVGSKGKSYTERLLKSCVVKNVMLTENGYFEVMIDDNTNVILNNKKILVTRDDLLVTISDIKSAASLPANETEDKKSNKLLDFMSSKNAIVRSFEEAGGKGLACTIDSLSFNWFDQRWETSEENSKAPMGCDISISLTPIHDIAPGLDSDNFNRAPIYNVGNIIGKLTGKETPSTATEEQVKNATDSAKRKENEK